MFKEMGLSLGEIRELLTRRWTTAELREVFRERRSALLRRMQEDSGRLAWIDARLPRHPGLFLAGNAYRGVALNDCTEQGELLAQEVHRFIVNSFSSPPPA